MLLIYTITLHPPNYTVKVKGKVVPALWAPCHGGKLGEWRYSFTHSLTSALDGGEWSASHHSRFTLRAPHIHWIGGWVGPIAVLDVAVKRKIPSPCQESNPRTPVVQPVAQCYTNCIFLKYIFYTNVFTFIFKLYIGKRLKIYIYVQKSLKYAVQPILSKWQAMWLGGRS
jgi:hypothetical protein